MRKFIKLLSPIAIIPSMIAPMTMTSCGKKMYRYVRKVADYLHEITYDDYREDTEYETIKEAEPFGCSSVRNGNFYGRNFDYVFNNTPEFIVRVKANKEKGRHESLAVSTHFGLREEKLNRGMYDKSLELIPNLTMDGINDAGVICSSNVVSMEPKKVEEKEYTPETNPDKEGTKDLHVLFIPRFVLDNANSVEDAIAKLKDENLNICGDLKGEMFIHTMIADANKTAIVEFFHKSSSTHNHFDVVEKIFDKDDVPTMTNFYKNIDSTNPEFTNDQKFGNERDVILNEHKDEGNTFLGMQNLLRRVRFSQAYEFMHNPVALNDDTDPSHYNNNEWYSEKIKQSELAAHREEEVWEEFSHRLDDMKRDYWIRRIMDFRDPPNSGFWITTHNSTYDMEQKHLQIIVQEEYSYQYDFYL